LVYFDFVYTHVSYKINFILKVEVTARLERKCNENEEIKKNIGTFACDLIEAYYVHVNAHNSSCHLTRDMISISFTLTEEEAT